MSKVHISFIGQLLDQPFSLRDQIIFTQANGGAHAKLPSSSIDFSFSRWKKAAGTSDDMHSAAGSFILAQAVKRERHRIARDLHDHAGQYVASKRERVRGIEEPFEIPSPVKKNWTHITVFLPSNHH
jgi:signal transduction histidine kinase